MEVLIKNQSTFSNYRTAGTRGGGGGSVVNLFYQFHSFHKHWAISWWWWALYIIHDHTMKGWPNLLHNIGHRLWSRFFIYYAGKVNRVTIAYWAVPRVNSQFWVINVPCGGCSSLSSFRYWVFTLPQWPVIHLLFSVDFWLLKWTCIIK